MLIIIILLMPQHITEAIVLNSLDFGESDKIVTFYTLSLGKIKGIAKGAKRSRKRFGINLEPFSMIRLHFFEKRNDSLVRVSACDLIDPFQGIREDLLKIAYGSYMIEVVEKLAPERDRHPELFGLLKDFLGILESKGVNEDLLRIFEIRALDDLGLRPHLSSCVVCRRPISPHFDPLPSGERTKARGGLAVFSFEKGGIICKGCSRGLSRLRSISMGTVKTLEMALRMDKEKVMRLVFSKDAGDESKELLKGFIRFHLGRELKSLTFIEKIKKL